MSPTTMTWDSGLSLQPPAKGGSNQLYQFVYIKESKEINWNVFSSHLCIIHLTIRHKTWTQYIFGGWMRKESLSQQEMQVLVDSQK